MRDKISGVVGGDQKWAEDVLKEAMIQEVNADAKDGINIFVAPERTDMKFNNFPHVEVEKYVPYKPSSVNIDVFPGETHKPTITLAATDNYVWGDIEPEPQVIMQEKEVPYPVYIKQPPKIIEKIVQAPVPPPVVVEKPFEVKVPVPSPPEIIKEQVYVPVEMPPPPCPLPPPEKEHVFELEVQPAAPPEPIVKVVEKTIPILIEPCCPEPVCAPVCETPCAAPCGEPACAAPCGEPACATPCATSCATPCADACSAPACDTCAEGPKSLNIEVVGPEGSFDPKDLEDLVIELVGPVPANIDKLINVEFADGSKPVVKTIEDAPKDMSTAVKTKIGEIAAP